MTAVKKIEIPEVGEVQKKHIKPIANFVSENKETDNVIINLGKYNYYSFGLYQEILRQITSISYQSCIIVAPELHQKIDLKNILLQMKKHKIKVVNRFMF
jgi:hypothetical protein